MPLKCSGTKYNADCIASVAARAGFGKDEKTLATATAIALAESSGNLKAVSPTGCCHGLWQINVEVHPYTKEQMQDPAQNAAAAWKISNGGTNWKPWTVYNTGAYLLFMPSGESAAKKTSITDALFPEDPPLVDALGETSIGDIVEFPELVRQWLADRNNIMRIVKVAAGAALIIAGAVIVMKPALQSAAGGAVKAVAKGLK